MKNLWLFNNSHLPIIFNTAYSWAPFSSIQNILPGICLGWYFGHTVSIHRSLEQVCMKSDFGTQDFNKCRPNKCQLSGFSLQKPIRKPGKPRNKPRKSWPNTSPAGPSAVFHWFLPILSAPSLCVAGWHHWMGLQLPRHAQRPPCRNPTCTWKTRQTTCLTFQVIYKSDWIVGNSPTYQPNKKDSNSPWKLWWFWG